MNIDKIPIETMTYSPGSNSYHLGTVEITKGEYANAEKINEIIDWMQKHDEKHYKVENK